MYSFVKIHAGLKNISRFFVAVKISNKKWLHVWQHNSSYRSKRWNELDPKGVGLSGTYYPTERPCNCVKCYFVFIAS